jgi:hypothetical protein
MGKIFFIIILLFWVTQIITQKGYKKLNWIFSGILFFPSSVVILTSPYITFPRFLLLLFFMVFVFQNNKLRSKFRNFPLFFSISLVFVCLLLIGLFDARIDLFSKISRPLFYFLENFIIVFLTYFYIKSIRDLKKIYNFIILCFVIYGLYGIINYITRVSLYSSFIAEIYNSTDFGNSYTIMGDSRFRIASFAWHPIYYGLLLALAISLLVFIYYEKYMQIYSKLFYITILGLLGVNLLWTNSRTPLVSLLIGLSFFYLFSIKLGNKVKIALIGVIVLFGIVSISPESLKLFDESINTFTSKGSKLEGSSVEMREMQMGASLLIFSKNPVFGNGFNYITEDLGFSSDENKRVSDSDFAGFESYIYRLLIEQGLVGIFANLFFFISLFIYLFKTRKKVDLLGKRIIYLSVSMTITFLLFIIGTGEMGTFMIFMALLGVNLKGIQLSLKNRHLNRSLSSRVPNYLKFKSHA